MELVNVLIVLPEIRHAENSRPGIGQAQVPAVDARVVFQGAHRRYEHHYARLQVAVRGNDVEKLLRTQIEAEACLGNDIIGQAERQVGAHDAARPLGDVGEGPAMDDGWDILRCLDQIREESILQESRDGPFDFQVTGHNRPFVVGEADQDPADLFLQFPIGPRQAQDGHDLAGGDDIESRLPGEAVG